MALIDNYSKEELEQIVANSSSLKEVIDKIGYATCSGNNNNTVKDRLNKYGIDYSHFTSIGKTKRTEENVFIKDSTASQKTLREWYKKGNYSSYVCSICGQEPVWQDKELTLILDHINGNNKDDRLENLRWVCPNCNQQLETTNGKNIKTLNKKYYCLDCGVEISHTSLRCRECANKAKQIPLEDMPISREKLKELIRIQPFTQIGKQFGVTDNAIRKWCDKFNLPRTKLQIQKYTDEEWLNI